MGHADVQTTMEYLHYVPREGGAALVAEAFRAESHRRRPLTDNRFARQLGDLNQREPKFVVPAIEAARASFAGPKSGPSPITDALPDSPPKKTWARVAEELVRVAALVTLEGNEDRPLGLADIELIHRGIFEPVFGEQTLDFRAKATDRVEFPIIMGKPEAPKLRAR
jgi:hypothetical protein